MARRDDNILSVIVELPWWVGVVLATIAYPLMRYAIPAIPTDHAFTQILLNLSGTFALPFTLVVLLAAAVSAFRSLVQGPRRTGETLPGASAQMTCPQCGGVLTVRQAKRGSRAGSTFLGCSNFPKCHYTQDR